LRALSEDARHDHAHYMMAVVATRRGDAVTALDHLRQAVSAIRRTDRSARAGLRARRACGRPSFRPSSTRRASTRPVTRRSAASPSSQRADGRGNADIHLVILAAGKGHPHEVRGPQGLA
jgi:hypothetical protein